MQVQARKGALINAFSILLLVLVFGVAAQPQTNRVYELSGPRLTAHFQVNNNHLRFASFKNAADGKMLQPGEAFSLKLRDGRVISASQMKINVSR